MLGVGFVIREIDMMLWGAHYGYGRVKAYDLVEISKLASCRSGKKTLCTLHMHVLRASKGDDLIR